MSDNRSPIQPDTTHRPTVWILEFMAKFGCFEELLACPSVVLTEGKVGPDGAYVDLPPGRFDPDKLWELYGADGDEFTRQSARLVASVYRGKNADLPFDFIEWAQMAPRRARTHLAIWLAEPAPCFP